MAKRKTVRVLGSEEVQGEGSFVKVSGVKVREIRAIRQMHKDEEALQERNVEHREKGEPEEEGLDAFEEGLAVIAKHIIDWDWVDDNDKPLPIPSKEPSVMDELTNEEAEFLMEEMVGTDAAKN